MKQDLQDASHLQVQEIFRTIQGEGPSAGTPAVFIRLVGCNLTCDFCDTDFESSEWRPSLDDILLDVTNMAGKNIDLVVITGGEPFRQNFGPLAHRLCVAGFNVEVETAGTLWIDGFDLIMGAAKNLGRSIKIICSPKTPKINAQLRRSVHSYKYIITSKGYAADGLPMHHSDHKLSRPSEDFTGDIYVQPCDEYDPDLNRKAMQFAVKSALGFGYKLSLQTHKITGVK